MKRLTKIICGFVVAIVASLSAQCGTLCSGESAATIIDLTVGTRTAALPEHIRYSTKWEQDAVEDSAAIVEVFPAVKPQYVAIDISGGTSATSYPVEYFDEIPGGVWSDEYKTTKIVLHRIPAGTFVMGGRETDYNGAVNTNLHEVTLTKDFYMGVFEVTQRQWELVMGNRPSIFSNSTCYAMRPVEQVSYSDIRGGENGILWPDSKSVDAISFMGRLRIKSGLSGFDLPTEAQWEYACRAGTTTAFNSGKDIEGGSSGISENAGEVARYYGNSGAWDDAKKILLNVDKNCDIDKGTAIVGSYLQNAFGLYDMHGNVWEICLDAITNLCATGSIDPVGDGRGMGWRVFRGGGYRNSPSGIRSANRWTQESGKPYGGVTETQIADHIGFRLCLHESDLPDMYAGEELSRESGSGAVEWMPTQRGTYILAHKVTTGGVQVDETLSSVFIVLASEDPAIVPENGTTFEKSLTISMSCPSEGAAIYYTIDGSEPTAESTVYKKFRIYGKTTVKAVAIQDGMLPSDVVTAEYALGRCEDPVISLADGTEFAHSNQVVSIEWNNDGVLRYTLDGSEPTAESPEYEGPLSFSDSVVIKAKVFSDDFFDSAVVTSSLTRVWEAVATPQIEVAEAFSGSKTKVVISCATEGALIRYTVNGTDPNSHSMKYTGPFYLTEGCTIKAYAVLSDYLNSAVAEKTVEKVWTIGDTMGKPDHEFETEGSCAKGWTRVDDVTAPNGEAMKSGEITHSQESVLSTTVMGPGTLSFSWRTSCEEDTDGLFEWDHVEFLVDGVAVLKLDGVKPWKAESVQITGDGEHTVAWTYIKDDVEFDGEDAVWVAGYGWAPERTETQTTAVAVPYTWLTEKDPDVVDEYASYELSANSTAANGNKVWECYAVGMDPTDPNEELTITEFEMVDGKPVVSVNHTTDGSGNSIESRIRLIGKENLNDEKWQVVPEDGNHNFRFFKAEIVLP